jgi:chromosome partitioning protein
MPSMTVRNLPEDLHRRIRLYAAEHGLSAEAAVRRLMDEATRDLVVAAADEVIVPLQCETLAHRGVGQFLRTVADVQQITNPKLTLLGALPTLFDSRTTHSRDVLFDVADRYDLPVLSPPIPRPVRFAEASASGSSVLSGKKNKGAIAYRELAKSLLKHWKSGKPLPTFTPDS